MNKKKITKIISFLLVLILLISFPLETQAHAVATESWMIYALITYLAGMGITFTVTGGVDAMIQAMEEKVNDYEQSNNIIDFYDYLRDRNVRLVPNNNQDPEGNNFFDLFFTASAVEAIQEFANWLTSEGGWNLGGTIQNEVTIKYGYPRLTSQEELVVFVNRGTYVDGQRVDGKMTYRYTLGEFQNFTTATLPIVGLAEYGNSVQTIIDTDYSAYYLYSDGSTAKLYDFNNMFAAYSYTTSDIDKIGFFNYYSSHEYAIPCFIMNDGNILYCNYSYGYGYPSDEFVELETITSIDVPPEIPRLSPEQTQGVVMQQFEIGSPEIQEWANKVEELFIETGTIPNPQPEIIQDPDFAPQPTPVPTPVPSPEIEDIEDLGLPTLGDAIFSKFPFSLPKDVGRIFTLLHADPVTPYWQVDLTGNALGIPSNFEVDLAEYEVLGQITRWFSVVSYCLFLILITRGMIKW